eukprot:NODE_8525_length_1489_cov_5.773862.p1 GENE.NODE_8525_length_1489_cov_5.773862~~NODE_8525_length_1489_cov_5.773862.p1  ORF type:complete len:392 (-),score=106.94 NODE_8525_length_1489_cov_5.773862:314-1414(-)
MAWPGGIVRHMRRWQLTQRLSLFVGAARVRYRRRCCLAHGRQAPLPAGAASEHRRPGLHGRVFDSARRGSAQVAAGMTHAPVHLHSEEVPRSQSAEAPPALVLPGLLATQRNFRAWSVRLARRLQRQRRVLRVDMRNHGRSARANTMSFPEMAQDVIALLDAHGIARASLIGHSMGGKVAMAMALLHPERVQNLVALDVVPVNYVAEAHEVADLLRAMQQLDLEHVLSLSHADKLLARFGVMLPAVRAFALTTLARPARGGSCGRGRGWTCPADLDALQANLDVVRSFDLGLSRAAFEAAAFSRSALMLYGERSRFVVPAHRPLVAQFFPHHDMTAVPHAGHWLHAEQPEETVRRVAAFLDANADE